MSKTNDLVAQKILSLQFDWDRLLTFDSGARQINSAADTSIHALSINNKGMALSEWQRREIDVETSRLMNLTGAERDEENHRLNSELVRRSLEHANFL